MSQIGFHTFRTRCVQSRSSIRGSSKPQDRWVCIERRAQPNIKRPKDSQNHVTRSDNTKQVLSIWPKRVSTHHSEHNNLPIELQLPQGIRQRHQLSRRILGTPASPANTKSDSYYHIFATFSDGNTEVQTHLINTPFKSVISSDQVEDFDNEIAGRFAWQKIHLQAAVGIAEPALTLDRLSAEDRAAFDDKPPRRLDRTQILNRRFKTSLRKQICIVGKKDQRKATIRKIKVQTQSNKTAQEFVLEAHEDKITILTHSTDYSTPQILMTSASSKPASENNPNNTPAQHRPLVVGLTKPAPPSNAMASAEAAAALNKEIQKNVSSNTKSAAPADESPAESSQPKQKKEKAPKQPKPPKAAPAAAPTSPALIDLRVGHILRAIAHPNADSLYVSTIAMGDPEGTEHTQVDEETGKVVRTVCSGLNGLIPLADMQDRKIIVVANLKPVNMRSIKSAAMVLAASPKQAEGADPHASDRVVELVMPPEGSEAGDKVYFEGWPYGEGKGPEKQLNPKKKQWEAIQPGFYTGDDLVVGFNASQCDEVDGSEKGNLVVEGKGVCTVKTLKGAVVR